MAKKKKTNPHETLFILNFILVLYLIFVIFHKKIAIFQNFENAKNLILDFKLTLLKIKKKNKLI